jgi:hypothetical protein
MMAAVGVVAAGVATAGAIWSTDTGSRSGPSVASRAPAPGWQIALNTRSAALNQRYGLGDAHGSPAAPRQDWYTALTARSAALDRTYGLGVYAQSREAASGWYTALLARSAALNQRYAITDLPCTPRCEVRHG